MKTMDSLIEVIAKKLIAFWYSKNFNTRNFVASFSFTFAYFLLCYPLYNKVCCMENSAIFMFPIFLMFVFIIYFYLSTKHLQVNRPYKNRKSDSMNFDAIDNLTKSLGNREKELIEKASWLNTLLSAVNHGLIAVNEEGKITICNTAASEFLRYETCMELKDIPITSIFPEIFPSSDFLKSSFDNPGKLTCIYTTAVTRGNTLLHVELCLSKETINNSAFLSVIIKRCTQI
jgi:PAS domain-containing protein